MLDEMSKEMLQNVPYISGIIIRKPPKNIMTNFEDFSLENFTRQA